MTITFLDCETTYQVVNGKKDPSPYNPKNRLVSIAYSSFSSEDLMKYWALGTWNNTVEWRLFYHKQVPVSTKFATQHKQEVQVALNKTTELVCHNMKFDLAWLWESGFIYSGDTTCTMIRQYVLNRGIKKDLSLAGLGQQYNLDSIKQEDLIQKYLDDNISMEYVPVDILNTYNVADIDALTALWWAQQQELDKEDNKGLTPTIKMMNEFTKVLIDMERNGIKIDKEALKEVKEEYQREQRALKITVSKMVVNVMGDTPVNLESPEQLSQLIYSRKVIDKNAWKQTFKIGGEHKYRTKMSEREFVSHVKKFTVPTYKTTACQCTSCTGKGFVKAFKNDGLPRKRNPKCKDCKGIGIIYTTLGEIAGFKRVPRGSFEAAAGGFRTNAETLKSIAESTLGPEKEFFVGVTRLNAIDTYLNTFVAGIEKVVGEDDILHATYMQCVAATGRLVSRDPNLQNQPRAHTFPIRRVFISRFENGKLTDADQGQLEYRTAVFLANDKTGRKDIEDGVDIHQITADIIKCSRQDAKAHTFKPLFGGSTGTDKEVEYYKFFLNKHKGIARWHDELQTEAISTKKIVLPSGREYAFPTARRTPWGSTQSTKIKNYPVQGFATADIVPVWLIELWYLWQEYKPKSLLCLTTHDDVVIDTHPDEQGLVKELILAAHKQIPEALEKRYDVHIDIPLMVEIKQGLNLLELETVAKMEIN